jgi:hypothetical protein
MAIVPQVEEFQFDESDSKDAESLPSDARIPLAPLAFAISDAIRFGAGADRSGEQPI